MKNTTVYALWMGAQYNIFDLENHSYKGNARNKEALEHLLTRKDWVLYEDGAKTVNLVIYRRK